MALYNSMYGKPFFDIAKPELLFEVIDKYSDVTMNRTFNESKTSHTFQPYNIMADHTKFDARFPFEYMTQPVTSVSMIRHPFTHLQSAFRYFGLEKKFGITEDYPLYEFLRRVQATGFDNYRRPKAHVPVWIRNGQMYTFGYPHWNENDVDLAKMYVKYIDCKFDLVFPLERLFEGLVLVRRRYNWTTTDILHFHNNKHSSKRDFLPHNDTAKMDYARKIDEKLNRADYLMYKFFAKKFDDVISKQDSDFHSEVRYFRALNTNISTLCRKAFLRVRNSQEYLQPLSRRHVMEELRGVAVRVKSSPWHDAFTLSHVDCRLMMIDTLDFQNALRVRQFPKACKPHSNDGPALRPVQHSHHNLIPKWCSNDTDPIYNFPLNQFLGIGANYSNWIP